MTMPRVDFYVLPENTSAERFACTIANKAWQQGHVVYIQTSSKTVTATMDDLLWTFSDISFVPHAITEPGHAPVEHVMIGWQDRFPENDEVLINLTAEIPATADRFSRVVEIVAGDAHLKNQARIRFKRYREQGYKLHNHTLEPGHDHT